MLRIAAGCIGAGRAVPCAARAAVLLRRVSGSAACAGQRRRFEGRTPYPRAHSIPPARPKELASEQLLGATNGLPPANPGLLETVRITDDEVNQIYDSIMSPQQRRARDEQSIRHRSRAEFLEARRAAREAARSKTDAKANTEADSKADSKAEDGKPKEAAISADAVAKEGRTISNKTMEKLIYVDTRVVREMEEAKRAVIASIDTSQIAGLEDKVRAAAAAAAREAEPDGADVELAPELTLAEFNHVIFANTLACRVDAAMQAFELLREAGIKPDQTTFANLTITHAKAGDLDTAVSMFKRLEEEGLQPTVYSYGTLIRAYMEFDRVDDAFRVYEAMKAREIWPNLPVYNSLIVACLKIGDFKRAWGVFEHLRYTIAQPDEVSFSIMIHACARQGEVERAMNLFEEMVRSNLALSDVTFNSLIHACAKRTDYFDECFRLLEMMESHGFQPDFYTYNTVIYACARSKNLALAREIFRDMLRRSLDPEQRDLLKIDPVTISNMMWAYAGCVTGVKNCSWRVAKRYEGLAERALADVQAADGVLSTHCLASPSPQPEAAFKARIVTERLVQAQEDAARIRDRIQALSAEGAPKEALDGQYVSLIDALLPEKSPTANNAAASEAVRLMVFYLDVLKGTVNARLLNAFLAALIKNGRFDCAWRVILGDFEKFNVPKDGWTFLRMLELCARTRDVRSAWQVWDEYKAWRARVERELGTPGHEALKPRPTRVYGSDPSRDKGPRGDAAAPDGPGPETLALARTLTFPGDNALPACVAGGALGVTPADREVARRRLGCDMTTEHATYIEMVTLLGSGGDFSAAVQLLREEKQGVLEHQHNPTMLDVNSLYQNAIKAGDKHAALDIRGLCMQKPLHPARRALHRKWGTSFSWDLTAPQHRSLSRRFPEEFRRHTAPFQDGEFVYLRQRGAAAPAAEGTGT
ncbi:hypothetical protein H4R18_002937 [Coemansia javaensis]|uniref:PROP1-like PPR domain-containing protein n=1 Tax=Coemansia javaensis TaxID=2761396 RepID=A0A9W8HFC0_9FUNG|nr:hypothetical protein H4R18_002937 [Coemansia javaensis]